MKAAVALVGALSLAGCGAARNAAVCQAADPEAYLVEAGKAARDPDPQKAFGGRVILAENCVLKTARLLARAPDPAETVAKAVVAQCEGQIEYYASTMRLANNPRGMEEMAATEVTTGKDVTYPQHAFGRMQRRALAAVVEARAGNCYD